jgi:DNA-binding transcriptional LysR family regulator
VSRANEAADDRVLVLTPTGRDAKMVRARIVADGMRCEVCADLETLLAGISAGAGAAVVAQEALSQGGAEALVAALEAQEPWSDIPVLLLSEARSKKRPRAVRSFFEHANITLLQRPLGIQLFS